MVAGWIVGLNGNFKFFFFWNRVLLCTPDWPGTRYAVQADPKLVISCISLLSARIIGVSHHAWPMSKPNWTCQIVFHVSFYQQCTKGSTVPTSSPTLASFNFFYNSHPNGCEVKSQLWFSFASLRTKMIILVNSSLILIHIFVIMLFLSLTLFDFLRQGLVM
jgi:hypothetical protein